MIKINARKAVNELLKNIKDGEEVDPSSLSSQLEGMDEETKTEAMKILNSSIQPVITKQEHKKVEVLNFPDAIEEVRVNNLSELDSKLKAIEDAVKAIRVEAPIINLPAPEVNVPETVLNIPAVDLTPLLNSLEKSLKLLRTNSKSNPLAVRLTDGADWIKEIKAFTEKTKEAFAAFPGAINIKNADGSIAQLASESLLSNIAGDFTSKIDNVTTTSVTYIGVAKIGSSTSAAVWKIKKIDQSGTPITTSITWAGGGQFNQVYDDRASLSYA